MSGLSLIDFDLPFVKACLENVKVALELLRGDNWISMDRKQPRIVCKGSDGGVICCGQVGCENHMEQES
jgi:hypothetical protein